MRCAGCELEPKKPARYCECCGKEISQHQAKAPETIDTDWAPKRSAWDLRCPKCGVPVSTAASARFARGRRLPPIEPIPRQRRITLELRRA